MPRDLPARFVLKRTNKGRPGYVVPVDPAHGAVLWFGLAQFLLFGGTLHKACRVRNGRRLRLTGNFRNTVPAESYFPHFRVYVIGQVLLDGKHAAP
jgi:hypothetical protein